MANLVDQYYNKRATNCMDCIFHMEYPDPHPTDYYGSLNKKIVCAINMNTIVKGCRPYNLRGMCSVPNWCHFMTDYIISRMNEKERE